MTTSLSCGSRSRNGESISGTVSGTNWRDSEKLAFGSLFHRSHSMSHDLFLTPAVANHTSRGRSIGYAARDLGPVRVRLQAEIDKRRRRLRRALFSRLPR